MPERDPIELGVCDLARVSSDNNLAGMSVGCSPGQIRRRKQDEAQHEKRDSSLDHTPDSVFCRMSDLVQDPADGWSTRGKREEPATPITSEMMGDAQCGLVPGMARLRRKQAPPQVRAPFGFGTGGMAKLMRPPSREYVIDLTDPSPTGSCGSSSSSAQMSDVELDTLLLELEHAPGTAVAPDSWN